MMTTADFKSSLSGAAPAPGVSPSLAALWWAAKGDWKKAHEIVQDEEGVDAAWFMPICIGSKAISAMPAIGTGGPASRCKRFGRGRVG